MKRFGRAVQVMSLGLVGFSPVAVFSQAPVVAAARGVPESSCCGPITPAGQELLKVLDGMDVEHLWQANMHVDWVTGKSEGPSTSVGKFSHTHCSAFAAAVGERLEVYMLRPPEHSQTLLASAQGKWFETDKARERGWVRVSTTEEAQRLANEGELVVLNFQNPDPEYSGHIAVVRPAVKSREVLAADGPETIQAGKTNFSDGNAKRSFQSHEGAWPSQVTMWAHRTKLQGASPDVEEPGPSAEPQKPMEPLQERPAP